MSPRSTPSPRSAPSPITRELAHRLHSAAIHLLRRLRTEDPASGLTGPQGSALSVLVFGGPAPLTRLASLEQVRPPTMSRLIADLERGGLVARSPDRSDRRVQWIEATEKGQRVLHEGRARRVARLEADLAALGSAELRLLERAMPVLQRVARPHQKAPNR